MQQPNKFNTTPDGTKPVQISEVLGLPTTLVVSQTTTPNIDLLIRNNPTIKTFIFNAGTYKITRILQILKNGIQFVGMTGLAKDVHIVQTMNDDGILIKGNNIILQNISIQCTFSKKSCLIGASINNTLVGGCYMYGSSDHFAVYYAGPSQLIEGENTLTAYTNYVLDTGNVFYNNVIYSIYSGDSVSFSLQYKGQFVGNFIRGGKIAIYMCRTTNIYNNTCTDSTTNGIYCSLPSDNLVFIGNRIYNSLASGIKVANQIEHGTFNSYNYNLTFRNNNVHNSQVYGIEMNHSIGINISNNQFESGKRIGIYSYMGSSLIIKNNNIAYFNFGIWLEYTTNSTVTNNQIMAVYPEIAQNAVKLTKGCTGVIVRENNLYGQYVASLITNGGTNNNIDINPLTPYYTLAQELGIYSVI
jgi:hypothetical protein